MSLNAQCIASHWLLMMALVVGLAGCGGSNTEPAASSPAPPTSLSPRQAARMAERQAEQEKTPPRSATVREQPTSQRKVVHASWSPQPLAWPEVGPLGFSNNAESIAMTKLSTWQGDGTAVRLIRFDPLGDAALVVLSSGNCHVVSPQSGASLRHWETDLSDLSAAEISRDSKRVVLQSETSNKFEIRDGTNGKLLRTIAPESNVTRFCLGSDPRLLAVGDVDGWISLFDIESGEILESRRTKNSSQPFTALAFTPTSGALYYAIQGTANVYRVSVLGLAPNGAIERHYGTPLQIFPMWNGKSMVLLCDDRQAEIVQLEAPPTTPSNDPRSQRVDSGHPSLGRHDGSTALRHGLQNVFGIQRTGHVIQYAGHDAFEYVSLYGCGPAGGALTEVPKNAVLAVAPTGKLAATAADNGAVEFYRVPPPIPNLANRAVGFRQRAAAMLRDENFDELDQLANACWNDIESDSMRTNRAIWLLAALSSPENAEDQGRGQLEKLQKWCDAKPDSTAAKFVLATVTRDYAWQLRGSDVAIRTSAEQFAGFITELKKAAALLSKISSDDEPSAPVVATQITVAMGLGLPKEEIIKLWQQGVTHAAFYGPLHTAAVRALLVRWGGDPGNVSALADYAWRTLPGDEGPVVYGIMAEAFAEAESPSMLLHEGFELEKLRVAVATLTKLFPYNDLDRNFAALVACMRGDHATARDCILDLAGAFQNRMWHGSEYHYRSWALSDAVDCQARLQWFASVGKPVQLAYSDESSAWITLLAGRQALLQVWNASDGKLKDTRELPIPATQVVLSSGGRYLLCRAEDERLLFDCQTGRERSWPLASFSVSGWISRDERQLVTNDGRGNTTLYDLTRNWDEPGLRLDVQGMTTSLEFLDDDPWMIAYVSGNNMIMVGETGAPKSLKVSGSPQRIAAVPGSHKVLAGGNCCLAIVDFEASDPTWLVQEKRDFEHQFTYSTVTVSKDGRLGAATRAPASITNTDRSHRIEIWDLRSRELLRSIPYYDVPVSSLMFSPDSKSLAGADMLGAVHVWELSLPGVAE